MPTSPAVETGIGRTVPSGPPSDVAAIRQVILARRHDFTGQVEQVLKVSLERPQLVAFGTETSLAAECGVAQATVLRAVRSVGFRGFADYRQVFRTWLVAQR